MKRLLWLGVAAVALTGMADGAKAQGYDKGDTTSRLMGGLERSEPRTDTLAQTRPAPATRPLTQREPARPAAIEPAAGRMQTGRPSTDFTGPYVGGSIGFAMGSYDVLIPGSIGGDLGMEGFETSLLAGIGFAHNFAWLGGYAGLEVAYNWSGIDGNFGPASFEKNQSWMVTLRPGLVMHQDALGYGIVGFSRADFESEGSDEYINGLVLGAGAEFNTQTPVKLRMEYTYINYTDEHIGDRRFDGHENNIKLGAVFRF